MPPTSLSLARPCPASIFLLNVHLHLPRASAWRFFHPSSPWPLGVASVRLTVVGTRPADKSTADVARRDGVVRISDEKQPTIVKACRR